MEQQPASELPISVSSTGESVAGLETTNVGAPVVVSSLAAELDRARSAFRLGDYAEVESALVKLVATAGQHMSKGSGSQTVAALAILSACASTLLGRAQEELGRPEQARQAWQRAIELFERYGQSTTLTPDSKGYYGVALHLVERPADAIKHLREAIAEGAATPELLRHLGCTLREQGLFEEAELQLRRAVDAAPGDFFSRQALGEVLEERRQFSEAISVYQDAAFALAAANRFERALALIERAMALDPKNPRSLALKGEILRLTGHHEEALRLVQESISYNPNEGWVLASKGALLSDMGRFEEALAVFDEALELMPDYAWCLANKGRALVELQRNADAVTVLEKAVQLDPQGWTWANLGGARLNLNRYEEALEALDRALELVPQFAWALSRKGEVLRCLGRLEDSLASFDAALAAGLRDGWTLACKGMVLRQLGRLSESQAALEEAVKIRPDGWVLAQLGVTLRELNKPVEALEPLTRAVELIPNMPWMLVELSSVLIFLDRSVEALPLLDRALALIPDYALAHGYKASALRKLDRYDESLRSADDALQKDPDCVPALESKGLLLRARGQNEQAAQLLERCLELQPHLQAIRVELGTILRELARYDDALYQLDQVLAENSDCLAALNAKAETLHSLGRDEEALQLIETSPGKFADSASALMTKPRILMALNRVSEAIDVLRRTASLNPAISAGPLEVCEQALESVDRAIASAPHDPFALELKGVLLRLAGRSDEAAVIYQDALSALDEMLAKTPSAVGLGARGRILHSLRRVEEAIKSFERALYAGPDVPWVRSEMAYALHDSGRDEEALEAVNRALELKPSDASAMANKGQILRALGRKQEAHEILEQALELDPSMGWVHAELGDLLFDDGQYDEAMRELDQALKFRPNSAFARAVKGQVLRAMGRYTEAVEWLSEATKRNPDLVWVYGELGDLLQALERHTEALRFINQAMERNQNYGFGLFVKGRLLCEAGEYRLALQFLDRALAAGLLDPAFHFWKAVALDCSGDLDAALGEYRQAASDREDLKVVWCRRGAADMLLLTGKRQAAVAEYTWIMESLHGSTQQLPADYLSLAGWCNFRLNNLDQALKNYSDALSLDPDMISSQFDMALILGCTNRQNLAVREYNKGLRLASGKDTLVCRGLLEVASIDLRRAMMDFPNLTAMEAVLRELETALNKARDDVAGILGSLSTSAMPHTR